MFKILSTYICLKKYIKCNIWRVAARPSYIQDARFLKVNGPSCAQQGTETATVTLGHAYIADKRFLTFYGRPVRIHETELATVVFPFQDQDHFDRPNEFRDIPGKQTCIHGPAVDISNATKPQFFQ